MAHKDALNRNSFAMALGLTCAIAMLLVGMLGITGAVGEEGISVIGAFYRGFGLNASGVFIGMLWGFIDGLVGGWIFASIYNKLV